MTPVGYSSEGGRVAPDWGAMMPADRGGVAVLDEDGVVLFTGNALDAERFMDRHGYIKHCNAEVVENRGYVVGFEPF